MHYLDNLVRGPPSLSSILHGRVKFIVTFKRLAALFLLLVAGAWSALVNGGPFFFPDTRTTCGARISPLCIFWAKNSQLHGPKNALCRGRSIPLLTRLPDRLPTKIRLNSPFDKAVMSGRSIYYGALLYVGHLTSNFWLSIFAQAAIFIYLSYTFVIKCARLSFFTFVCTTAIILVATPVSFFISFLTPDIFASFLILATIILVGFWSTLKLRDRVFVTAIILYSILVHTSHLLLLICIGLLAFVCFIFQRKTAVSSLILKPAIVLSAIILSGFLGELIFSYSTRLTIGTDPTRPPFVMARLIQDGPGYQFLQKNCATKHYVVCNYMDRLSIPSGFLWSTDPNEGVYNVADLATRIALSSEEVSFVLDVFQIRSDWGDD